MYIAGRMYNFFLTVNKGQPNSSLSSRLSSSLTIQKSLLSWVLATTLPHVKSTPNNI